MTKAEYKRLLATVDWNYDWADDGEVWRRGLQAMATLRRAQVVHDPEGLFWNEACPPEYQLKRNV